MSAARAGGGGVGRALRDLLLRRIPDRRDREEIATDLEALRRRRAEGVGALRAGVGYWWELLRYAWILGRDVAGPVGRIERGGIGQVLESGWQDLKFAIRGLTRAPAVALVAVPTIALAVGASAAIFSFSDALLLRPLPVREPDRLVAVWHVTTGGTQSFSSFSYPDYVELRDRGAGLEGLAAYSSIEVRVGEGLEAERVEGQIVSGNFFEVLGVEPLLGRGFLPEEDRTAGTNPVVIVGEDLWRRRFGRDPAVLGTELALEGRPFTVVGVAPHATPSGDLESRPQLWVPLMMHRIVLADFRWGDLELFGNRGTHWLDLLGRLTDGTDRRSAEAALAAVARAQAEENPQTNAGWSIRVARAGDPRGGPPAGRRLVGLAGLLAGVVAIVLLIACANVANLLLARATVRRQEMGVRVAIGAGRRRLVRLLLTEALTLSVTGGVVGLALAYGLLSVLPAVGLTAALPGLDVRLDGRVLAFALGLSVFTGSVFGLVPALEASAARAIRAGGPAGSDAPSPGRPRLRQTLVVLQVALSLLLLVGAGLMIRTVWNLRSVPLGFDAENVSIAPLDLDGRSGSPAEGDESEVYRRVTEAVGDVPGVRAVSLGLISPFSTNRMANDILWDVGDSTGVLSRVNVDMNVVDVGYFATMGIALTRGRAFDENDRRGGIGVAIVNEAFASRVWPGESPLGKRMLFWNPRGPDEPLEIVGVAADGRYYRSWQTADRPFVFLAFAQSPVGGMTLHVRGGGPRSPLPEEIRRAVLEAEPSLPPPRVLRVSDARSEAIALQSMSARLMGMFGTLAALIAAMGIYGVVSFTVTQRTHEIGVRVALGARPADVRRYVVGGSLAPILTGTALGLAVSLGLGRYVSGLLFEVGPSDPLTLALVASGLTAVGIAASWVPARRATGVSPLEALRE